MTEPVTAVTGPGAPHRGGETARLTTHDRPGGRPGSGHVRTQTGACPPATSHDYAGALSSAPGSPPTPAPPTKPTRDTEQAREAWRHGHVIPHRITTALDLRELYGPEVDQACGVQEPAVDEWEEGVRYPTWEQLLALADLTGFPVKFFTTMLPANPVRVSDTTLAFHMPKRHRLEDREPVLTFTPEAVRAAVEGCCVACLDSKPGARHTCEQTALF